MGLGGGSLAVLWAGLLFGESRVDQSRPKDDKSDEAQRGHSGIMATERQYRKTRSRNNNKSCKANIQARSHKTRYYSLCTLDTAGSLHGLPVWWLATEKRRVNVNLGRAHPLASLSSPKHLDPWPPGSSGLQPELTALIACWEPGLLIRGPVDRRPALQPLSSHTLSKKPFIYCSADSSALIFPLPPKKKHLTTEKQQLHFPFFFFLPWKHNQTHYCVAVRERRA